MDAIRHASQAVSWHSPDPETCLQKGPLPEFGGTQRKLARASGEPHAEGGIGAIGKWWGGES